MSNNKIIIMNKKGSMLVAVLIVMFITAAIIFSLVQRSIKGSSITKSSKQGYSAYQVSDSEAEKILNEIKEIDSDKTSGEIPENTDAGEVCGGAECLNKENNPAAYVSDIERIKQIGEDENSSSKRAVSVPVPARVANPVTGMTVKACDGTNVCNGSDVDKSYNTCDALLTLSFGGSSNSNVDALELRKAESNLLNTGSWMPAGPTTGDSTIEYPDEKNKFISNYNFDHERYYYFAVKAKNKNNFSLDSLYYPNIANFTAPEKDECSGGQKLGCLSGSAPEGSQVSESEFTCCNNTTCYECKTGYVKDGNGCKKP